MLEGNGQAESSFGVPPRLFIGRSRQLSADERLDELLSIGIARASIIWACVPPRIEYCLSEGDQYFPADESHRLEVLLVLTGGQGVPHLGKLSVYQGPSRGRNAVTEGVL